jgi:lipopolysaccharide biosynthesis glycosyltransferase
MSTPTLHVGLGLDEAYAPHGAVAITSVFRSHPSHSVDVHVLHSGLSSETERALGALAGASPHHRIHLSRFTDEQIGLPGFARFSAAVHLRFLLPGVLPESCSRVLYLDADTVVADRLDPLWRLDLGDATLAAVIDDSQRFQLERLAEHGLSTYVNSGVLLIDVVRWRERHTTRRLYDRLHAHGDALAMPDQDGLNLELADEILLLDRRWNVQRPAFLESHRTLGVSAAEHRALVRAPGIVHFTDYSKPWHATDQHPLGHLYRRLRSSTPFADASIDRTRSIRTRVSTTLKALLLRYVSPEVLPTLRSFRS